MSGLDDAGGVPTPWATALSGTRVGLCVTPRLSLGWDWQLEAPRRHRQSRRLGLPHTNILLLDRDRAALPWNESLQVLANFIDGFNWNTPAFRAVCERYAA